MSETVTQPLLDESEPSSPSPSSSSQRLLSFGSNRNQQLGTILLGVAVVVGSIFVAIAFFGPRPKVVVIATETTVADDLQPIFACRDSPEGNAWLGADLSQSIPKSIPEPPSDRLSLGLSRATTRDDYIWIFGDTLVGDLNPSNGRDWVQMPRNTVAWLAGGQQPPTPNDVTFFWKDQGVNSTSIFAYDGEDPEQHWIWPISSVITSSGSMITFGVDCYADPTSALGFNYTGTVVSITDNPLDDPSTWTMTHANMDGTNPYLNFWTAVYRHPSTGMLYLYGQRHIEAGDGTVLARIPEDAAVTRDWSQLEYLKPTKEWSSELGDPNGEDLYTVMEMGLSESTVTYEEDLGMFVMLLANLNEDIKFSASPTLIGPWSTPETLFQIPSEWAPGGEHSFLNYAAKAHPELRGEPTDPLVWTYMVNADWDTLISDCEVYVPRFMRTRFFFSEPE